MADLENFKRQQYEFAAYLRDPENQPAPADVEARRMNIYRDLFFNNVRNLLGGTFPVLLEILGEERWALLIRDFYRDHKSHSPLFPDLPREFLNYLAEERATTKHTDSQPDLPFMYELAHYEWVEAGLMLAADNDSSVSIKTDGDLLADRPIISNAAWLLAYAWPVNKIGKSYQPTEPAESPLYYLVYRNSAHEIIFMTLNATSARLFEIISDDGTTSGKQALQQLATELQHPDTDKVINNGLGILNEWLDRGVILGTVR